MKTHFVFAFLVIAASSQAAIVLSTDKSLFPNAAAEDVQGRPVSPTGQLMLGGGLYYTQANPDTTEGDWFGNFTPGDRVQEGLGSAGLGFLSTPRTFRLYATNAFGFEIQSIRYGDFWVELRATYVTSFLPGGNLTVAETDWIRFDGGKSTDAADGTANFVGLLSDPGNPILLVQARVRSLSETTFQSSFGVANPRYGSVEVVPEPASMAPLGLGALAILKRRKKA